ncbi:MAG: glycine cleavage system aminomethyltransferase GcvT [Candidatus Aminicenantes bacterium]|jgi:aminomethyltransferase|nr:glycine cleavage system aminomethyltransferase GcvT [Candidatus Aminicenantes bacterium]
MKKTRLNSIHKLSGARMIEFAGWEMPVEYKGIIDEHLAVRTRAGLFDVSHMGEIFVEGPEALACVQYLTPNDVSRLSPGMVQYTALTTPEGTFVDDMLVYCLSVPDRYLLVVNAANTDKDYIWVKEKAAKFKVQVTNKSDDYTQLALQGPLAQEILQPLTDIDLSQMKSFNFAYGQVAGVDCLVSRTGYTGEDGFEIYTLAPNPEIIWKAIIERGTPLGLLPVGLGARDTLRLEAKLMLYGNDITDKTTVLEADLKWIIKFQKGDFLGRAVLEKQLQEGLKRKLVGFEMVDKGIARPHYPVFIRGEKVSEVCSGTFAPFLKKAIGLVYLPIDSTEIGTEFEIGIRDKKLKARVIPTPFYKREKK